MFKIMRNIELKRVFQSLIVKDSYREASQADFIFCSSDVDKSDFVNGKHFSRQLDSISHDLSQHGFTSVGLAQPFSLLFGSNTWQFSYTYNRKYFMLGILDVLRKYLGFRKKYTVTFFEDLFRNIKPQAIFVTNNFPSICEAANKLGIPVIEVLHGRGYKQVFSYWGSRSKTELPTNILAFDSISYETFRNYRNGLFKVDEVRDLWNSELINSLENTGQNIHPQLNTKKRSYPNVLFSMQWGYDGDCSEYDGILSNGLIPEYVIDAVELTQNIVNWQFRLHPIQLMNLSNNRIEDRLEKLIGKYSNAEWRIASTIPLPRLLSGVTHHITMCSMTTYEASELNIPTLALCPSLFGNGQNSNLFDDLRSSNLLEIRSTSADEIVNWIESTRNNTNKKNYIYGKSKSIIELISEKYNYSPRRI